MNKEERRVPDLRFKGFYDDWEQRKLIDIVKEIGTGRSSFVANKLQSSQCSYPVLGSTNVISYDEKYDHSGNFILTARVGANAGSLYTFHGDVKISDNTVYIQTDNWEFIYNLLLKFNLKKLSFGTGQPLIKSSELKNLSMRIPDSKKEQMVIGNFLTTIENMITLHQRKVEKLLKIKKGNLQKIFPRYNQDLPEMRFNYYDEVWRKQKAKSIFKPVVEKNQPELPVLSVTQENGVVYRDDVGKDIKYDVNMLKNYKVVHPNDFIISLRSFQGGFELSNLHGITSPAYTIFEPINSTEHHREFWKTQFKSYKFIESLKIVTFGIRDGKSINFSDFGDLILLYPSNVNEQSSIGLYFQQFDKIIQLHHSKLNKLEKLKKAYLRKMFL